MSDAAKPKLNPQQVARAGEHFVAAELHRRGAYAVTFAGNMPDIDILASDVEQTRTVAIQVKTSRSGTWQTDTRRGKTRASDTADGRFWVFVDLSHASSPPAFYVVPEWWIQNDIHEAHQAYLDRHGGQRARNPESTHHSIKRTRIEQWLERWDKLELF
jgi:Holliday junction resolvase-like predicted endonuclease